MRGKPLNNIILICNKVKKSLKMSHLNNDTDFSSKNSEQYPPCKPEGTERKACFQMISLELFPMIALQSHTSRSRIKRQIEITIQNIPAIGLLRLSGHR